MQALAFNLLLAATHAWRGKWNRHAVAPSDNFWPQEPLLLIFAKKIKIWGSSGGHHQGCLDRTMWESLRIEISGEGCTSLPGVKPLFAGPTWKWKFLSHKDKNPSKLFFFHDPLVFGWYFEFCIPGAVCNIELLRSQRLDVFKIYLRFWSSTAFFLLSQNSGVWSIISVSMSAVKKKEFEF